MAQRSPGSFRLLDRPYLIACAIGGISLVAAASVAVSLGALRSPGSVRRTWVVKGPLASRPNRSTGWVSDIALDRAVTPYLIRVHLRFLTMELFKVGRRAQPHSPVILPLGTHATVYSFGGGLGTVAIHTRPKADVFGTSSSAMAASEAV